MATIRRKLTPEDVDKIARLNEACGTYFQRDPDRADAVFAKPRRRQPIEVSRAKSRLRTARWRSEMDRRRAPTVSEVGMALAVALATTSWSDTLTSLDYDLIRRALSDLEARGFDPKEVRKTMRRLRTRMVDPGDRQGEADESCGPPSLEDERKLPF
ncbi:hypothetical protein AB7008_41255 [Bradyrhizobium sp. 521_C7_N1_3]|uniref:hypothetical protein n=1 Tax=Bradyrhizobium sp. 521_C7_N1_3 TaxID=3240368 RepID=UPI003F8ADC57